MKLTLTPFNLIKVLLALSTLSTLLFNSNYVLFGESLQSSFNYDGFTLFYLFSDNLIYAKILSVIVLILVLLGFFPIVLSFLHWYITYSFVVASDVTFGGDNISANITLLLIPCSFFQNKINHYKKYETSKNVLFDEIQWVFYIAILIQISLIYFQAFYKKILIKEWIDGTAVFYYITNVEYGLGSYQYVKEFFKEKYTLVKVLTWSTLLIELIVSLFVFFKHKFSLQILKKFLLIFILFHFILMVCFGIFPFFIVMCGLLVFYVLPRDFQKTIQINF